MEPFSKVTSTKEVLEAISNSSRNRSSVSCWRCLGVGVQLIGEGMNIAAKNCLCVRRTQARAQLAKIPPVFSKPKLSRLRPRPELHQAQVSIITFLRAHANDSFLFVGRNGAGKSHFAWALFRNAIAQRRPAIACTVRDLLSEYRRVEVGVPPGETLKSPRVSAADLRKPGKPWLLFLDEFEKARPSEFAAEQLFNLLDAARSFNHQLVITSNLNVEALRLHWSRVDAIWGNSILTRLENCHQVEMF